MPQNSNLSEVWQQELGENWQKVQKKYLHTIGNLTLTGYNSKLSDRPFKEKQCIIGGFRDSPLRLNQSIGRTKQWNEDAILARAAVSSNHPQEECPAIGNRDACGTVSEIRV